MISMTASMTGRSNTRLEFTPNSVELCGMVERSQRNGNTADQHEVEDVCADDVANGQITVTFNQRSNGRDQLRQRSTQRDKGQGDDAFGHAQRLGNQRTVINEQICAQRR